MDLILWRHAEAEMLRPEDVAAGADPYPLDLERALTAKGERQAQRMAEWINRRIAASTRVLVSPARRTRQTAEALGRPYKVVASLAPGATVEDVLQAARWPDASEPVLVVGHQPTLGLVAAHLLAGLDEHWSVKKGAVWWLRHRVRDGLSEVTLQAVQAPDLL